MTTKPTDKQIQNAYAMAKERYAMLGVDSDKAIETLAQIPISLHCWQGDDVAGFESPDSELGGGIAATGNYPGKARNGDELRRDLDKAYSLIPGTHRLNLHAIYAETGGQKVERNELQPEHFAAWVDWAKDRGHGMDFNPTCFSHPKAESGFTLASYDDSIRQFWIEHCIACRKIGEHLGRELHDGLCQTLAGIAALSSTLGKRLAAKSESTASAAAADVCAADGCGRVGWRSHGPLVT